MLKDGTTCPYDTMLIREGFEPATFEIKDSEYNHLATASQTSKKILS